ncbi:MAG: hypothetical protein H7Z16_00925 [Pyrinomonadaceae bacterium]|nr:hypothetical protein [Pyrinomonadaceae bacterium]
MCRFLFALTFSLSFCTVALSQHPHNTRKETKEPSAAHMPGMGTHHHPVSTTNPEAQKFFDQGLRFVFAFNHEEAIRSFKRAAELDPQLAMAHWGIALALGPNINLDVDPEREKAAYEAAQKAQSLKSHASEHERAYLDALVTRYSLDPKADLKKLAVDYKNAMADVVKRYPDDLDAATLYAESAMNLRPWKFWTADGKPAEGTEEIVATLESVLRRDPNHIGAIHYYIHAVEASNTPERALAYAPQLPTLVPAAGHLVHMPSHIYARTGDYEAAALSNKYAARVDEAYMKARGGGGFYPAMYYSHNLHFLAIAEGMSGRFAPAIAAAKQLEVHVGPHLKAMPMLEGFMTVSPLLLVRFNRWDDIEKLPAPDKSMVGTTAVWHFARGMAFDSKGRSKEAAAELDALIAAQKLLPADANFGLNSASHVLKIAEKVLAARLAYRNDRQQAISLLRSAVELEDSLSYDEPQAWFIPVREALGAVLMRSGDHVGAEAVFRADLEKNRRNGRSLFGLMEALKAQKKNQQAMLVKQQFEAAWKSADTKLTLDGL